VALKSKQFKLRLALCGEITFTHGQARGTLSCGLLDNLHTNIDMTILLKIDLYGIWRLLEKIQAGTSKPA